MSQRERCRRLRTARAASALLAMGAFVFAVSAADAEEAFTYADRPIHPGCIHALAMHQGDAVPVTTAVSLAGHNQAPESKDEN